MRKTITIYSKVVEKNIIITLIENAWNSLDLNNPDPTRPWIKRHLYDWTRNVRILKISDFNQNRWKQAFTTPLYNKLCRISI